MLPKTQLISTIPIKQCIAINTPFPPYTQICINCIQTILLLQLSFTSKSLSTPGSPTPNRPYPKSSITLFFTFKYNINAHFTLSPILLPHIHMFHSKS